MLISAYYRVSTLRQENEETIENQRMAVKEFAEKSGHTIIKEYFDDGWSGTVLARPALDDLRMDAKGKTWEAVLIYDPDRLARKYSYQELIIDELQEAGVPVLFVTTPPAEDDSDRLLMGVKGLFAEYERAKIAERFRLGKLRKAKDGKLVTGNAPYGYQYIPRQANKDGYYKIIKSEAGVARMIFSWIGDEGLTIRAVVRRLHEMGIPPRKSQKKLWNTSTLVNMLRNETYIGTMHFNKGMAVVPVNPLKHEKYKRYKKTSRKMKPREDWVPIPVPALIGKDLYKRTMAQLKINYEMTTRNKKNDYLLAGLIYCLCGRRRTGEGPQHGKHLYYRCSDRVYSHPLPSKCKIKAVNARIADKLVWDGVANLMSSPKLIQQQANRWLGKKKVKSETSGRTVEDLKTEIDRLRKEESRYVKAYGGEVISLEQFEEAMTDLKTRRAVMEKQIGLLESQRREMEASFIPKEDEIKNYSKAARLALTGLSFETKRAIMLKVIDAITSDQKTMVVRGYLPVQEDQNVEFRSKNRNRWLT